MRKVILPNLKRLRMFENKKILITGGTGSLGTALTAKLLKTDVDTIRIFGIPHCPSVAVDPAGGRGAGAEP